MEFFSCLNLVGQPLPLRVFQGVKGLKCPQPIVSLTFKMLHGVKLKEHVFNFSSEKMYDRLGSTFYFGSLDPECFKFYQLGEIAGAKGFLFGSNIALVAGILLASPLLCAKYRPAYLPLKAMTTIANMEKRPKKYGLTLNNPSPITKRILRPLARR